jgi:hypothetical protein
MNTPALSTACEAVRGKIGARATEQQLEEFASKDKQKG